LTLDGCGDIIQRLLKFDGGFDVSSAIDKKCKWGAILCALLYFASYVTRNNFNTMLVKVCADMGCEKSAISVVTVAATVAYGVGQVVSGLLGDKIKPERLLFIGTSVTICCNVAMFFCQPIPLMAAIWFVNGCAQSMMWPPMVRLLASNFKDEAYSYALIRVSWGSSFATILLYLACPLLLYVMNWRTIMLLCAAVGGVILAIWLIFSPKIFKNQPATLEKVTESTPAESAPSIKTKLPLGIYLPLVMILFGIIAMGVLRDGVTNWMPSYLQETFGMKEENSILSALVPAVLSLITVELAGKFYEKMKNETVCAAIIYGFAMAMALALYLIAGSSPIASTIIMGIVIGCMHGVNFMLISIAPKRFVKYGKVSTMSGVLNSCTYIGAAASTYGFAVIAENFGWQATTLSWVFVALFGGIVCIAASKFWKKYI